MSKLLAAMVLALLAGIGAVYAVPVARAALDSPPDSMSPFEAAQLDAAIAHMQRIQQVAQIQSAPHVDRINALCAKYQIKPESLGRTVTVDFATGIIKRVEAKK